VTCARNVRCRRLLTLFLKVVVDHDDVVVPVGVGRRLLRPPTLCSAVE
jgi:hypothetical protein